MLSKDKQNDFSQLWVKAYPAVSAFVSSMVADYHCAEDVLGRVSTILVEKIEQYDHSRPFEAWAIGIARYEVMKYYHEKANDKLRFSDDLIQQIGEEFYQMSEEMSSRHWALQKCLGSIDGRAAEAITLRYGENFRYKAIASRLGMKAGAVRTMLHRTRDALRRCIEQHHEPRQQELGFQEPGMGES